MEVREEGIDHRYVIARTKIHASGCVVVCGAMQPHPIEDYVVESAARCLKCESVNGPDSSSPGKFKTDQPVMTRASREYHRTAAYLVHNEFGKHIGR